MLRRLTRSPKYFKGSNQDVLFADFVKVYAINREMMWKILAKYGVPEPLGIVKMPTSVIKAKTTIRSISGAK
jgi:hypothetical protein